MSGKVITEEATGAQLWIADRRIGKTAEGKLTDNMNLAITLVCGVHGSMPLDDAIKAGLVPISEVGVMPFIAASDIVEGEAVQNDDSELIDGYMYNGELEPFPNGYKSKEDNSA